MSFVERFDDLPDLPAKDVLADAGAIDGPVAAIDADDGESGLGDPLFDLGGDQERRMHVRAYNHWVSLLKGRDYPPIEDLDPASIADFGPHSVLLDFTAGVDDPAIAFLGRALRAECDLDASITHVAQVPSRSLLSRLTDHYLQIIANRAPIGFEAEFIGTRGATTLYRGILMPFSSDGTAIDFIYGVINWKEVVDAVRQVELDIELAGALRGVGSGSGATPDLAPIWADGPGAIAAPAVETIDAAAPFSGSLADRLMVARESAAGVRAADTRSRAALYRALGRAHDFAAAAAADDDGYRVLLDEAGLVEQPRAPMTPVVKLVFGADHDKTRLAEYAAVLAHARRHAVATGGLPAFLDEFAGGVKAVVAAERLARRPAPIAHDGRARWRDAPVIAALPVAAPAGAEFVVLVARAGANGMLDLVATVEHAGTVDAALKRAAV